MVEPIDVGATLRINGVMSRVTNIWIDEDSVSHLTLRGQSGEEKVTYEDVKEMLESGDAERVNTGHEAWNWRTN